MSLKLRQFQFYSYHEVLDRATRNSFNLLKDVKICYVTANKDNIVIGDSSGCIYVLNKLLSSFMMQFGGYSSCVFFLYISPKILFLFCIGEDVGDSTPILKVFDLKTLNNRGTPFCCKQMKLCCSDENVTISCATIHESLTQMAIGYTSGTVVITSGDISGKKGLKEVEIKKFQVPITGLKFVTEDDDLILFITTLDSISCIDIKRKSVPTHLESTGCNPNCCTVLTINMVEEFFVAGDSTISSYSSSGRNKCIPVSGNKGFLRSFNNNLIFTVKHPKNTRMGKPQQPAKNETLQIITFEDKLKFTSFVRDVPDVADVVYIWGSLYVFLSNGQLYELIELDLESKIKILFSKNLFDMAINLAKRYSDKETLNRVICKYGDYLYQKGDIEQSMEEYIQTIGTIEPSYIIRKFLEAQSINYLTAYLESLHRTSYANSDHTTLLLNCYIRLKDTAKLDNFLRGDKEWHFDTETALRVCHQAGFIDQSLCLAKKSNNHSWYLKILLEDLKNYKSAIEYLKNLTISEAENVLKNYGRRLLRDTPKELVELLKAMCTYCEANPVPSSPEDFIHIFVQQRQYLLSFLEYIVKINPNCSKHIYNTLIELYVYELSNPQIQNKNEIETKCLNIINLKQDKYDIDHVLMLCQLNHCISGLVCLYEKMGRYSTILQYHIDVNDYDGIINDCIKYGDIEPQLWRIALEFFTKNRENCEKYLIDVISYLNTNRLITPVELVKTLAKSNQTQVKLIKDYITEHFNDSNAKILKNNEGISRKTTEINRIENELLSIESHTKVFQNHKCSLCQDTLELPAVHFFCGHSFHHMCAESQNNENSCQICTEQMKNVKSTFVNPYTEKELEKLFKSEIAKSSDPLETAIKYLKYDIFRQT